MPSNSGQEKPVYAQGSERQFINNNVHPNSEVTRFGVPLAAGMGTGLGVMVAGAALAPATFGGSAVVGFVVGGALILGPAVGGVVTTVAHGAMGAAMDDLEGGKEGVYDRLVQGSGAIANETLDGRPLGEHERVTQAVIAEHRAQRAEEELRIMSELEAGAVHAPGTVEPDPDDPFIAGEQAEEARIMAELEAGAVHAPGAVEPDPADPFVAAEEEEIAREVERQARSRGVADNPYALAQIEDRVRAEKSGNTMVAGSPSSDLGVAVSEPASPKAKGVEPASGAGVSL